MAMFNKILRRLENPRMIFMDFLMFLAPCLDDKTFLKYRYRLAMGHKLDLERPQTFNQKLQWLKLYQRDNRLTALVDKYRCKFLVSDILGDSFIIPTLAQWETPNDIDISSLPDKFVLKVNHDSGGVVICRDKESFDIQKAKQLLANSYNRNYYLAGREWPYKNVKKCIFAEELIEDTSGDLFDYKLFCFNGKVKFLKVDFDRQTDHHANYYSPEWELMPFGEADFPPKPHKIIEKPENLDDMVCAAEKLANGVPFVRIDFYNVNHRVYFGEFTLFPASGFGKYTPVEYDQIIGDYLTLPTKNE